MQTECNMCFHNHRNTGTDRGHTETDREHTQTVFTDILILQVQAPLQWLHLDGSQSHSWSRTPIWPGSAPEKCSISAFSAETWKNGGGFFCSPTFYIKFHPEAVTLELWKHILCMKYKICLSAYLYYSKYFNLLFNLWYLLLI